MTDLHTHFQDDQSQLYKNHYSEFIKLMYHYLARAHRTKAIHLIIAWDTISVEHRDGSRVAYHDFIYPKTQTFRLYEAFNRALQTMIEMDEAVADFATLSWSDSESHHYILRNRCDS